jgi:hypothetical protein
VDLTRKIAWDMERGVWGWSEGVCGRRIFLSGGALCSSNSYTLHPEEDIAGKAKEKISPLRLFLLFGGAS